MSYSQKLNLLLPMKTLRVQHRVILSCLYQFIFFFVCVYSQLKASEAEEKNKEPLPFTNQNDKFNIDEMDPSKHLLAKYHDKLGNAIAFFDNCLPKEAVDAIRSYFVRYGGGLMGNAYDEASSETHDNVAFIYTFEVCLFYCPTCLCLSENF